MTNVLRRLCRRLGLVVIRDHHAGAPYVEFPPATVFDYLLLRTFPDFRNLRFLQVGANDGRLADPLARYLDVLPWRGVMVEPLPTNFARLHALRGGRPGLRLLNAAVDLHAGRRALYDLTPEAKAPQPAWSNGLASFSRERLLQAAASLGLPASAIATHEVETVTWDTLWARLDGACDLLVLDTEGWDIPLLRAADLGVRRPRVILFEHACHTDEERFGFYRELTALGYNIATDAGDTVAALPSFG